jgi:COMPASS component SWD3
VTASDATLKIWDAATGEHQHTLRGHLAGISTLAWAPDSTVVASGSDDKSIRLWNALTGKPYTTMLLGHHNYIYSIAFSPKGNILVSGSYDESVMLWDVRSGRMMRTLPAHSDPVSGVDFVRDGTLVVSGGGDGLMFVLRVRTKLTDRRVWDTPTGQCLRTLISASHAPVSSAIFSPNGRYILAWTLDSCVRLWSYIPGRGRCVKTYQGHINERFSISGCFGPRGEVVSGSEDGSVVIWDVESKELLQRLQAHEGVVLCVDYADGKLASCGVDGTIRLWREGEEKDADAMDTEL